MKRLFFATTCGLILTAGAGLVAQSGSIRLSPSGLNAPRFAERWRPANGGGETKILGTIIDISQTPVAHARVRLRSLIKGTVDQEAQSDANGEYEFLVDDPGTYVVEMVLVDGSIRALSNAGSLARYETMRTVIQLPGRWDSRLQQVTVPQTYSNFVGMGSQATMTAATLSLAVDMNIAPTNSGEPVSPFSR